MNTTDNGCPGCSQWSRQCRVDGDRGAGQSDLGRTPATDSGTAGNGFGFDAVVAQHCGDALRSFGQHGAVGFDGGRHGCRGAGQCCFECGEGQLVDAQCSGKRMSAHTVHRFGVAEDEAGLRPAQEFVAACGDQCCSRFK